MAKTGECNWIFTFGNGQKHAGHYVKIYGTFWTARSEMFRRYGKDWSLQYSEDEWNSWVEVLKKRGLEDWLETELIEVS